MHYTEIEMAESISTPTKISARNPVCRLCGGSYESRYMLRIFSKAFSRPSLKALGTRLSREVQKKKSKSALFSFCQRQFFSSFSPNAGPGPRLGM